MQAHMNTPADERIGFLRAALKDYQKNGGSYKDAEKETGISRTSISMLANHGMTMPEEKLVKLEGYLSRKIGFVSHHHSMMPAAMDHSLFAEPQHSHSHSLADVPQAAMQVDLWSEPEGIAPCAPDAHAYKTSVGIYPTDDYKKLMGWCAYIYRHRKIGAMVGYPGSGKTTILRAYARHNPAAHYIECWSSMTMADLLEQIADAVGVTLKGRTFQKEKQLMEALRGRTDVMLMLDESEYLKKWNVEKFDALRKIWDNTGTPVIFCGTPELINVLTRGTGKDNCAQLYRRILKIKLTGIRDSEALEMLEDYNIDPDAAKELVRCAVDHKHGGIGNMAEILQIALESAEGGQVDLRLVEDARAYKLMY